MQVELTDAEVQVALGGLWAWKDHCARILDPAVMGDRADLLPRALTLFATLDSIAEKLGGDVHAKGYGIPPPSWGGGLPPKPSDG